VRSPTLILLVVALASITQARAQTQLSFNIFLPPTHFMWRVFPEWADDVHAATGGEVSIEFPARSVSPAHGVLYAVRHGVTDGGLMFNEFLSHGAPGTLMSQMPWLHRGDSAAISTALWENYRNEFAGFEQLPGVELLSMFHLGPTYLCSVTDTPVTTIDELRRRRVWALPGMIADTLADLDLAIVASPAIQVQELVSRNTVDVHMGLTLETMVSFAVASYTRSCVEMNPAFQSASFSVFFNRDAWTGLTQRQRTAIGELSGVALSRRLGQATNEAEAAARTVLVEEFGVTFAPAGENLRQALEEAAARQTEAWKRNVQEAYGVNATEILDELAVDIAARTRTD